MTFFYWNKSFEIGIPAIDAQHRKLVDLINDLAAGITDGAQAPDVLALFCHLRDYAAVHFRDEELLMNASALSNAEKHLHRQEHLAFVNKAQEIASNPGLLQAEAAEQVLEFLTIWLISHILGSDKKVAAALHHAEQKPRLPAPSKPIFRVSEVERTLLVALTETERRFRMISDHSPVLMWVADSNNVRGFFNRGWRDYVGLDRHSSIDTPWRDAIHPDDLPAYLELMDNLLNHKLPGEAEFRLRRNDGQYRWFLEKVLPRIDSNGVFFGLIGSAIEVTAIKEAEARLSQANVDLESEVAHRTQQLEKLMLTDPLTGVGNRRMMMKALSEETVRAQRYQRPYSLLFLDLDHFKHINDTHGHAAGDAVLIAVASCLAGSLRDCDLLGRIGGEEFVLLLPETSEDSALQVAQRMRTDIEQLHLPQIEEKITISAGIAQWRDRESGDDLLQRADRALYQAKEAGRNCCRTAATR